MPKFTSQAQRIDDVYWRVAQVTAWAFLLTAFDSLKLSFVISLRPRYSAKGNQACSD